MALHEQCAGATDEYHGAGFWPTYVAPIRNECPDCGATNTKVLGFACQHERCPMATEVHLGILDDMDHEAKYDTDAEYRKSELRIQALGAAISRKDWHATEQAYAALRDKFYSHSRPPLPTGFGWINSALEKGSSPLPVAYITKMGLESWLSGTEPEQHVLLRSGNDLRVALYASPPTQNRREP